MSIKSGHVARELLDRGSVIVMGDLPVTLRAGFLASRSAEMHYDIERFKNIDVAMAVLDAERDLRYGHHDSDVLSLNLSGGRLNAMLYTYTDDYRQARRIGGHVVSF